LPEELQTETYRYYEPLRAGSQLVKSIDVSQDERMVDYMSRIATTGRLGYEDIFKVEA
jgi:hypothetical protein